MSANMFSQRALQLSMRRLAATPPSSLCRTPLITRALLPTASRLLQLRPAATTSASSDKAYEILAAQRRHRPVSPHLSIYRPQVTWILSGLTRVTGVTLSGTFYLFGIAYLVAPAFGWHLESASIAAAFASWPVILKVFTKGFFAMPFAFHFWNGIRHLIWDTGAMFTNRQVMISGWTTVGLTVATALGLTFM